MRWPHLLFLLPITGCFIDAERCGDGFSDLDERCVPSVAPSNYYPDPTDGAARQPDVSLQQEPDAGRPVDPVWGGYTVVLIADLGTEARLRQTPQTPGLDLDAVLVTDASGATVARAVRVVDALINDPFGASRCLDASRALGPADLGLARSATVCLGARGAFIALELGFEARGLQSGDGIEVFEDDLDGADGYALYVCDRIQEISPRTCTLLGRTEGSQRFELP